MVISGYRCTVFHYQNIVIRLKIPDFQLNILFDEEQLAKPILITKLYPAFLGVHLEINNIIYSMRLPLSHENFYCNSKNGDYLLAWWEWYKPQRSKELKKLIRRSRETVTSIIKNEESIYLSISPLSEYLQSNEYDKNIYKANTKEFENIEYRKEVHYITEYGQRSDDFNNDLLKENKSKYARFPRLWRESKGSLSKNNKTGHAFVNYGTHTERFKSNWIKKVVNRVIKQQVFSPENTLLYKEQKKKIVKSAEDNYQSYYCSLPSLPITLIIDTIIID